MSVKNTLVATLKAALGPQPPARLGIAVSGGGDSMALMRGLRAAVDPLHTHLFAATVDHGLRPEAAAEAEAVRFQAEALDIPHVTLVWQGWDRRGNLQDQARRARYALLGGWARELDLGAVALGHTQDDQAETVLMRLARSGGVDGLAAMGSERRVEGVRFVRPLLTLGRAELRAYLKEVGVSWSEDPSNADHTYARIRVRAALKALAPAGITATNLAEVARNMDDARGALNFYAQRAARELVVANGGDLLLDPQKLAALPAEIARRLLVRVLGWVAPSDYPPRRAALADTLCAIAENRAVTLGGAHVFAHRGTIWIVREYNALRGQISPSDQLWDGRWQLCGPHQPGFEIRALGETGLTACTEWRASGRPRAALIASPSVWFGDQLIAAPLAHFANGWTAECVSDAQSWGAAILSH